MKNMFIIVLLSLAGLTAMADTDSVLNECQITCSARCKDYAEEIMRKAQDVLDCQGSSNSGNSDVINACVSVFGNGSAGQQCSREASSVETVRTCASVFGNGSTGLDCATSNAEADVIRTCSSVFGNGSSGLTCAKEARDAGVVRTCASNFGNGSAGLSCATGN